MLFPAATLSVSSANECLTENDPNTVISLILDKQLQDPGFSFGELIMLLCNNKNRITNHSLWDKCYFDGMSNVSTEDIQHLCCCKTSWHYDAYHCVYLNKWSTLSELYFSALACIANVTPKNDILNRLKSNIVDTVKCETYVENLGLWLIH